MVATVFRVMQDPRYDFIRIAEHDYDEWAANMLFEEAARGVPLRACWNEDWDLVAMEEDLEDHPGGLGHFATMLGLIAAISEEAVALLTPLVGEAAEVLKAHCNGEEIRLFNVVRRVDRKDIGMLDEGSVFRINPVGLDVLCGRTFKEAIERSGLTGLRFRKVDQDDEFGMV